MYFTDNKELNTSASRWTEVLIAFWMSDKFQKTLIERMGKLDISQFESTDYLNFQVYHGVLDVLLNRFISSPLKTTLSPKELAIVKNIVQNYVNIDRLVIAFSSHQSSQYKIIAWLFLAKAYMSKKSAPKDLEWMK